MAVTATINLRPDVVPDGSDVALYKKTEVELERQRGVPPIADPVTSGTVSARKFETEATLEDIDYVLIAFVDEVQEVKVAATGGQFKSTFEGQTTADIAYNATAKAFREAFEALSNVAPGDVEVTGGPGDEGGTKPYVVKFQGAWAGKDVEQLTVEDGSTPLEGEEAAVTVTTKTVGSKASEGGKQRYVFYTHES